MPTLFYTFFFWSALAAVIVAQVMILRSSLRAMRASPPSRPRTELGFAIAPALILALVLVMTWRAAMRPATIQVEHTPHAGEVII